MPALFNPKTYEERDLWIKACAVQPGEKAQHDRGGEFYGKVMQEMIGRDFPETKVNFISSLAWGKILTCAVLGYQKFCCFLRRQRQRKLCMSFNNKSEPLRRQHDDSN